MSRLLDIIEFDRDLRADIKSLEFISSNLKAEIEGLKTRRDKYIKAGWIIAEVSRLAQTKIKKDVEDITTKAIRGVFGREFDLVLKMEYKRSKFECQVLIEEDGELWVPKDDYGIGLSDMVGFVLRIVLIHLEQPRKIDTLILDEPFRFMGSLSPLAGMLMKEISEKLGLQIIILTHDEALASIADVKYMVERNSASGSYVNLVKGYEYLLGEPLKSIESKKPKRIKRPKKQAIVRIRA